MYAKYHTDALVLGSVPHGEADKRVTLFTRDFGLIRARASAVRTENSRMRYALQTLAHARVSLIRGATGWRVAGAQAMSSAPPREATRALARIAQLTMRLVSGEEKNENLFFILREAHAAFAHSEKVAAMELVCVARILHALGYLSPDALGSALFIKTAYDPHVLDHVEENKDMVLASVNHALSETHL